LPFPASTCTSKCNSQLDEHERIFMKGIIMWLKLKKQLRSLILSQGLKNILKIFYSSKFLWESNLFLIKLLIGHSFLTTWLLLIIRVLTVVQWLLICFLSFLIFDGVGFKHLEQNGTRSHCFTSWGRFLGLPGESYPRVDLALPYRYPG